MKHIAIDGNEANVQNRVGVNNYAYEILKNIALLQDMWSDEFRITIYLKEKPLANLPQETECWRYKVIKPIGGLWILTRLMPHLLFAQDKPALLFSPSHYSVPFSFIPRICSIMDLGYLNFSGQFKKLTFWQLKYWTAISIIVSKRIIAISNATKKDIVRHYPFASKKIVVTHLGYDKAKYNRNIPESDVRRIKSKYTIVDDYILYLGTLKPSKNIEGIIKAFSIISKKNIKLVITGKKGWMYEKIGIMMHELNIKDRIVFTDFLPEEDKPMLMKGARLLISPSFWEGFGLHVLEAMACGTPVVVSDRGSLVEVVGNAGIIVDPEKPVSIKDGIEKVLNMPEKSYNELKEACVRQAGKFSWEKTAQGTLEVFRKVIE